MKNEIYERLAEQIECKLQEYLSAQNETYGVIYDAMRYSVLGGGKRLRGVLMLESGALCGIPTEKMLPFACAIEMIHASTLIHDDLPCMDNDDYRRGQLSCHKKFGDDIALLAGDALYAYAFSALFRYVDRDYFSEAEILDAVTVLMSAGGADGVLGGQILDKKYEKDPCDLDHLLLLHSLKTGALFSCCVKVPIVLSHADNDTQKALTLFIKNIGVAFQVKDDLLDLEGDFASLGKAIGADSDKSTFVTILGKDKSRKYLQNLIAKAKSALPNTEEYALLQWVCDFVMNRNT